jgi:hypothetical protein
MRKVRKAQNGRRGPGKCSILSPWVLEEGMKEKMERESGEE